ncbi:MAG: hypothetical protein M3422_20710, partial [Actinomycetota bacterium]|nr:hypothetical protein [Actinomycetota bacterium]
IWVPIIVGIIGLAGVIIGQLINSRREDRRWKREADREDLRWQRERQRLAAQRAHELALHWSLERKAVYASLLKDADAYLEALLKFVDATLAGAPTGEVDDRLRAQRDAIAASWAQIDIVGSPRVRAVADELVQATMGASISVHRDRPGETGTSRAAAVDKARRARDAFLREARGELGVDEPLADTGPG